MGCCCDDDEEYNTRSKNRWEPLKKRSCTDVIPLTLFTLFFIGMLVITSYSVVTGAADRLIYGFDSYGNVCNKLNKPLLNHSKSGLDLRGKPFIFFMDDTDAKESLEICVEKCPDVDLNKPEDLIEFYEDHNVKLCDYDVDVGEYKSAANDKHGPCPKLPASSSTPVLFRCLPDYVPDFMITMINQFNHLPYLNQVLADIYLTRYALVALCFIALLLSIITVALIRFWASFVVIVVNILLSLAAVGVTVIMWWMYVSSDNQLQLQPLNITLNVQEENRDAFFWYSIIATVGTVFLLLLVLVMRKRVQLTVELFYEAGKCLTSIPAIFLQPIWTFVILIIFWLAWLVVFGCLATAGEMKLIDEDKGWVEFIRTETITYMWWYHLIGLFWITEFILACQQMVIAGAVAEWYFARNKSSLDNPILKSTGRLITNHLGSCAFGAFFIVLVSLPRFILTYIHRKFKDSENQLAKLIMKCCICCLWILEKLLRYLNYNAYSLVAINGTHFCRSACDAVATILSSPLRVAAINSIGSFVLFLGKLLVAVVVAGVCGVFILRNYPEVQLVAAPVALVFFFSYLIASCFLSIYSMAIDTLFLCFCEDQRVNDGSVENGYFMSKSLLAFVKKGSKHIDKLEGKSKETEEEEAGIEMLEK